MLFRSRNSDISLDAAFDMLPIAQQLEVDLNHLKGLVPQYTQWKRDSDLLDYEDLLEQAMLVPLPVKFLVLDEAQDSSPMLWRCVSAWAHSPSCRKFVAAGDPFQAIHLWSGASPEVFQNQPGEWVRLKKSHRLTDQAAQYAKQVLA